ncbi:hypothetical protein K469DRAFT_71850 [Zopfia rhizophila CBS 207.26]|uniref:Uncharacterized protein n=1 Tax=Zopfia rhizophila CBS 207.26 TaxID=1314779 RepID=A0A6A6EAI1_9PEZI|nr:hypothetical protein K469DRAFT_71850 [Zopfia rhizophila CBS 207.26]
MCDLRDPNSLRLESEIVETYQIDGWRAINSSNLKLHTAVLLLHWEKEWDDLNFGAEVDALARVFRYEYRWTVEWKRLHGRGRPQAQINQYLANFVAQYDDFHTLLIIYYAGHGMIDASSQFIITAPKASREITDSLTTSEDSLRVQWSDSEVLLRSTTADVLTILDCCFASNIAPSRESKPCHTSRYELLAPCDAGGLTPSPGRDSFTTALIWALHQLKSKESFDTLELKRKISEAPYFSTAQQAGLYLLSNFGEGDAEYIKLASYLDRPPDSPILYRTLEGVQNRVMQVYTTLEHLLREYNWLSEADNHVVAYRSLPSAEEGIAFRRRLHGRNTPRYSGHGTNSEEPTSIEFREDDCAAVSKRSNPVPWYDKIKLLAVISTNFSGHKTTVLAVTSITLVISTALAIRAYLEPRPANCSTTPSFDDNFYTLLSQAAVGSCSIYLTIVPLIRSRRIREGYRIWYRLCLLLAFTIVVSAAAVYPYSWRVSTLLGAIANLTQIIGTVQLVECFQDIVED